MSLLNNVNFQHTIRDSYEYLIADRLIDEVHGVFKSDDIGDITKIRSAFFDLVIIGKVLRKIGVKFEINPELKKIRDSVAHIDERLEVFDFKPTIIKSEPWSSKENKETGQFKMSKTFNFQGAIAETKISTSGEIEIIAPYGIVEGYFLWIDKNGSQKSTTLRSIDNYFDSFLDSIKQLNSTE